MNDALVSLTHHIHHMTVPFKLGVGCIDKFSPMVFLENILQCYYIPNSGGEASAAKLIRAFNE